MATRAICGVLLVGLMSYPSLRAVDGPLIQILQIRGTRRPLSLETRAGEPLDLDCIERDVRRLWAAGWFDDIQVETSESPKGVRVTFSLVERPRLYLRRVRFEPGSERRPLELKQGARIDAVTAQRAAAEVRRQLVEEGYAEAEVEAKLTPVGFQQADLALRVKPGRLYRVQGVRFAGSLGLQPQELRKALRHTRPQRVLPGLGPLWQGWRLLAPLSDQRLQADLAQLRSLYLSQGYFDARIELSSVETVNGKSTIEVHVDSGPQYRINRLVVTGSELRKEIPPEVDNAFPHREFCRCLFKARRRSEKRGELTFAASLEVARTSPRARIAVDDATSSGKTSAAQLRPDPAWVAVTGTVTTGPVYNVGKIEFRGHRALSDATLRKALLLDEGDLFDQERLRRSMARLSSIRALEPVTPADVEMEIHPEPRLVDLAFKVREKPRGRWALSGLLGSLSAFGPLQFTIGSRLPGVGRGALELSTYYASLSLLSFPAPWVGLAAPGLRMRWAGLVAFERPSLPGQRWQSGFFIAPQLGWRGTLGSYGFAHGSQAIHGALKTPAAPKPALSAPVRWRIAGAENDLSNVPPAGVLLCEPQRGRLAWLRGTVAAIADAAGIWWLTAKLQ